MNRRVTIQRMDIGQIITLLGYTGIFLLMIPNGVFAFPSSQVLYIITGYFIFTGNLFLVPAVCAGALGNTVGNIILYELVRRRGVRYITRWKIFPEREIRKVEVAFGKRGPVFLFIAKLLPAIKVFAPIPAGIARMHRGLYAFIILTSSALWSLPFIAVGYYFGKSAHVFKSYAFILLIIALVVVTLFYRYMNSESVMHEIEGTPEK